VEALECLSIPVVEFERIFFLGPKGASGTLKEPFEGLEKRLFAMESVGTKSSSDEVSQAMSSSRNGLFLFSFSVNSGSMEDSVRSCQPFWALKLAKAKQS
jgi:hypothetical protein